jgi:hypothetical protein
VVVEHQDLRGSVPEELTRLPPRRIPQGDAKHVVDVDLKDRRPPKRRHVGQAPLATCVLAGCALHSEPHPRGDLIERGVELRTVGGHRLPVRPADVVDVDVDRQPRNVEHDEVQRSAALQRHSRPNEGVRDHHVEQAHEHPDLLERVDREPVFGSSAL